MTMIYRRNHPIWTGRRKNRLFFLKNTGSGIQIVQSEGGGKSIHGARHKGVPLTIPRPSPVGKHGKRRAP